MSRHLLAAVAALALSAPLAAQAAPTIYFGEDVGSPPNKPVTTVNAVAAANMFTSGLTDIGTETFEEFSRQGATSLALTFGAENAGQITAAQSFGLQIESGADQFGRYPISGSEFLFVGTTAVTLQFDKPVSAFGFYATDVGDYDNQSLTVALTDDQGVTTTFIAPNTTSTNNLTGGGNLFYGIVDPTEHWVKFTIEDPNGDERGYDDMMVGTPVSGAPEPASWALAILGLAFAGGRLRSRRRDAQGEALSACPRT